MLRDHPAPSLAPCSQASKAASGATLPAPYTAHRESSSQESTYEAGSASWPVPLRPASQPRREGRKKNEPVDPNARGRNDASAPQPAREKKKVLRGVEPRLKECPIQIESETFVLTVILQDPFTDGRGGLAYSNSHTAMPAHSPGQAPPHGRR